MLINIPLKVWIPKIIKQYTPKEDYSDINEGTFDSKQYMKAVFWSASTWEDINRNDSIDYDSSVNEVELDENIRIGKCSSHEHKLIIRGIVNTYWDCFCKRGSCRLILKYELLINTGTEKLFFCRKPRYGSYESQIISKHAKALLGNDWIEHCEGAWGSSVVLVAKPHQEHIENIDDFVWRMCVSYNKLNAITKPFKFPIPRFDDVITIIDTGSQFIWIINLDVRQGYHQVSIRKVDREQLAFFAPDSYNYTFKVMPFGPTSAPAFYPETMKNMKDE